MRAAPAAPQSNRGRLVATIQLMVHFARALRGDHSRGLKHGVGDLVLTVGRQATQRFERLFEKLGLGRP